MKLKKLTANRVKNKIVILRTGYDVPIKHGKVLDDKRIKDSLETIQFLIKNKAKIIIITHLKRPEGKIVEELRLDPIANCLQELVQVKVIKSDYILGNEKAIDHLKPGEILMLENIRFVPEEESTDQTKRDRLGKMLAKYGQVYINEAFSDCHRDHASITSIPQFLPSYPGFALQREVETINNIIKKGKKPFVILMGGAKLKTKIPLIKHLLPKASKVLIAGAMVFTFYAAKNIETGKSLVEKNQIQNAKTIMKAGKGKIILPLDIIIANKINNNATIKNVHYNKMPKNMIGVDIGHVTIAHYKHYLKTAKTILWNGPLGLYEIKPFKHATESIAKYIAHLPSTKLIGGGDTGEIIHELHLEKYMTLVATGGGASLALCAGEKLPGLKPLSD